MDMGVSTQRLRDIFPAGFHVYTRNGSEDLNRIPLRQGDYFHPYRRRWSYLLVG
jgi:hypothetical protein